MGDTQKSEIEALRAELERVQKQNAAMREALEYAVNPPPDEERVSTYLRKAHDKLRSALQPDAGSDYVHKSELERVQRQNAAMREAMEELATIASDCIDYDTENQVPVCHCCGMELRRDGTGHKANCMAGSALDRMQCLADNAGSQFISRESVRPIVEALAKAAHDTTCVCCFEVPGPCFHCDVEDALATARTLGFDV